MAQTTISLLGELQVTGPGGEKLSGFESNKVRALLAYVCTEVGRSHSRQKLAGLFWPDLSSNAARANLRLALYNLRKVTAGLGLSQPLLDVTAQSIRFLPRPDIQVDVITFNRLFSRIDYSLEDLDELVTLYKGDFLEGFALHGCTEFDNWLLVQREHTRLKVLEALRRLEQLCEASGNRDKALWTVRRLVELEPWDEAGYRDLMRLLALTGQHCAALAQYENCQRVLSEELGITPSPETNQLYEQLRLEQEEGHPCGAFSRLEDHPSIRAEAAPQEPPTPGISLLGQPVRAGLLFAGFVGLALLFLVLMQGRLRPPNPAVVMMGGGTAKRVLICDEKTGQQLCRVEISTGRLTPIEPEVEFQKVFHSASWSPDGKQIVFAAVESSHTGKVNPFALYRMDEDGRRVLRITAADEKDIAPAWSPDGNWIAFHRSGDLWVVRPDGSQEQRLSFGFCIVSPAWSPDGKWLAFIEAGCQNPERQLSEIRVLQFEGRQVRTLYEFGGPATGLVAWSACGDQIYSQYIQGDREYSILVDVKSGGVIETGLVAPHTWLDSYWPQWN